MCNQIRSPGFVAIGSSRLGENSYSHHRDDQIGVAVIDRFTYFSLDFLERMKAEDSLDLSVQDYFDFIEKAPLRSNSDVNDKNWHRPLSDAMMVDFFSARIQPQPTVLP